MKLFSRSVIVFLSLQALVAASKYGDVIEEHNIADYRSHQLRSRPIILKGSKLKGANHSGKRKRTLQKDEEDKDKEGGNDKGGNDKEGNNKDKGGKDNGASEQLEQLGALLEGLEGVCFSPKSQVSVKGRGRVSMKNIAVGDEVLTGSGDYKPVITIDHYHPSKKTEFVQIHANLEDEQPLELTPKHLVFTEGSTHPIPASEIKVGDKVQAIQGLHNVVKVERIEREGFYNPVTSIGTIVADGIVASTYASITGKAQFDVAGLNLISMHSASDMAFAPYRAFCTTVSMELCKRYGEIFGASSARSSFHQYFLQRNDFVKFLLFVGYVFIFGALDLAFKYNIHLVVLGTSLSLFVLTKKTRKSAVA